MHDNDILIKFMKKFAKIFIITAVAAAVFISLGYYMTYHIIGTVTLTVNGSKIDIDGSEIGIQDDFGYRLEACEIRNGRFRFKRKQYGKVNMLLMIPADHLQEFKEDIAVEISFYNNAVGFTKKHDINIEISDITEDSCHVFLEDNWEPAYDIGGLIRNELVGETVITQEKEIRADMCGSMR